MKISPVGNRSGAPAGADDQAAAEAAFDTQTDQAIGRLVSRGLVELGLGPDGQLSIRLTEAGQAFRLALDGPHPSSPDQSSSGGGPIPIE